MGHPRSEVLSKDKIYNWLAALQFALFFGIGRVFQILEGMHSGIIKNVFFTLAYHSRKDLILPKTVMEFSHCRVNIFAPANFILQSRQWFVK